MKKSLPSLAASLGPLGKKTFASALDRFFEDQCPQVGGDLTRKVLVTKVQQLVEEFYPPIRICAGPSHVGCGGQKQDGPPTEKLWRRPD